MRNKTNIYFLLTVIILVFSGCQQSAKTDNVSALNTTSSKKTNTSRQVTNTSKIKSNIVKRIVPINQTKSVNGLDITIDEVGFENNHILVAITTNNKSNETLSFFPDQKTSMVISNTQLQVNMFSTEGDLSGDIFPGSQKSGVIAFSDKEKLSYDTANKIDFKLGNVYSTKSDKAAAADFSVDLKQ